MKITLVMGVFTSDDNHDVLAAFDTLGKAQSYATGCRHLKADKVGMWEYYSRFYTKDIEVK